jgi:membrane-associated phospholipid phosphatase
MFRYPFIVFIFFSLTLSSQNFGTRLLKDINLNRNTAYDNTFKGISHSVTPFSVATPVALFGVSLITKDTALRQNSFYTGATLITTVVIVTSLKYGIDRTRPYIRYPEIDNVTVEDSPSFPSGHTSEAFALATSLSMAYPRWYIIAPSYIWAGSVAYSRMHLGVHYPGDVLAGAFIGAGSAFLCYKGQQWLTKKREKKHNNK